MTTGKIEYAPDYGICPIHRKRDDCTIAVERTRISLADFAELGPPSPVVEHQRLQLAVVEAAKVDRMAEYKPATESEYTGIDNLIRTRRAFRAAVTALLAFEAEHKIGE